MLLSSAPKHAILVIGAGSIGQRHIRCFQETGQAGVDLCEPNAELAQRCAAEFACQCFPTLESALAAKPYDAAVICTPAHLHLPLAASCLDNGLHLLIEKPLAVSLNGMDEFQAHAASSNRIVRIAYTHRSIATHLKTQELLLSGAIGRIRHVTATSGHHFPTARPAYRDIYYNAHATGGGAVQDALTHIIHAVEWLANPVQSVFAHADHLVLDGTTVEDTVNMVARLRDGTLASFALNQYQPPWEVSLTFHGTHGSIRNELHNARVGIILHGETDWSWHNVASEGRDQPYLRQAQVFLAALNGKPDNLCSLDEAIQTLKVNLAALQSAQTHREVII